eukprot:CAMPEP_0114245330 /NCGR_PEP_ID=MMETSP0058-20121206/11833_1 /TAXON_ID=36894 /ORGANISM="Pyramimonas parkeae, CCMP726" /LENGTH=222 /DNA_ID=CAMNT_0001358365 /DNA_START=572 /DNA_END=1240 /DNA_ORIENTATION=+
MHVCADGGINRLFNELPRMFPDEDPDDVRKRHIPDFVIGDLDSVDEAILNFYTERGTGVLKEPFDQDCNDLHKCIRYLHSQVDVKRDLDSHGNQCDTKHKVLIVGGLGGRMDHEFANINALLQFPQIPAVLISDDCFLSVLSPGRHQIIPDLLIEGRTCGLIPLCGPTIVTTTGLKWNLENTEMRYGALVSTSNQIVSSIITVKTDQALIWTTEAKKQQNTS